MKENAIERWSDSAERRSGGSLSDQLSLLPPPHEHTFILSRVPVTIRPAQEKDIPSLDWGNEDHSAHERRLELQGRGAGAYLVATINDHPIGYAMVVWEDSKSADDRNIPEIEALTVFPALRGLGIGSALIAACEDVCRNHGFDRIGITLHPVRHSYARALYERLGYRYHTTYLRGLQPTSDKDVEEGGSSLLAMELIKELQPPHQESQP